MTRSKDVSGLTTHIHQRARQRLERLSHRFSSNNPANDAAAPFHSGESLRSAEERLALMGASERKLTRIAADTDLAVAVVVPTYNDCKFLGPALRSVANQTHPHWRCYVVDDGSEQAVERVFDRFSDDERFVLLRHGANAGLAAARNTGARFADEPLLQFLDADDLLTPWALEMRVEVFRSRWSDPFLAGVYGQIHQCTEETNLYELNSWTTAHPMSTIDWLSSDGDCPFNVHAPLVRRSAFVGVGGFNEQFLNGAEDWELWQRILRHGHVFRAAPHVVGAYRQRKASMVRENSAVHVERAAELLARANQSAILRDDAPMAYTGALGALRADYFRTKRAAIYAGLNCAQTASIDEALRSVEPLVDGAVVIPTREREFAAHVRSGLIRGLGLVPSNVSMLQEATFRILGNAASEISYGMVAGGTRFERLEDPETDMAHLVTYDIVLIAEHAGDVDILEEVAVEAGLNGLTAAALDIETGGAAQGANDRWRALGRQLVPYNALCLGALSVRAVVGRRPGGPTTWSTLATVAAHDGFAVVIDQDNEAITVPESPPSRELIDIKTVNPSELSALVAPAPFWSMPPDPPQIDDPAQPSRALRDVQSKDRSLGSEFVALLPREESRLHDKSMRTLRKLRNAHAGETAVLIGNGPSLNDTDLDLLKGTATFGVNSIFLAGDRLPEPLTFYVVEDSAVMKENTEAIKAYDARQKLFPTNYLHYFDSENIPRNTAFFRMNGGFYNRGTGTFCLPRFSTDASQRVFCGQSVTIINLQLAYWMGFEQVVLIGMDFSYQIPDDAEVNGELIVSRSDDPNHFHPDYFGAGKTWKDPHLDRVLANYRLAKQVYEADGRRIVNATVGGALEEFERSSLAEVLR